jgi:hypothetical protein
MIGEDDADVGTETERNCEEKTDKGFGPAAATLSGTGFSSRPPGPLVLARMEGFPEGDGPTMCPAAAAPPHTTGKTSFAVRQMLCRTLSIGRTAKRPMHMRRP